MKINFLLPALPWRPVGGYRVVYEYANNLAARKHEITIIYASHLNNSGPFSIKKLIKEIVGYCFFNLIKPSLNWSPLDPKVKVLYVWEPVSKNIPDADVIFATLWWTCKYINEYGPEKGKKYYLVMDFAWLYFSEELSKTWKMPFRKIAISGWLAQKVVDSGASDVHAVPLGIDNRFKVINPIENREKTVSIMYHRAPYKDIKTGIKALEICRRNFPGIKVFAFGPYIKKPALLPEWITYSGRLSEKDLVQFYNKTSIFVSSSIEEGFAFPPAEAMACGCAVVSTDCGGIREYALHTENCLLSQPQDERSLADNIFMLLKNDSLRKKIATKGNENIKNFNWEKSTALLENLLLNWE